MATLLAGATCPKCEAPRTAGASECPRCGVVYARAEALRARAAEVETAPHDTEAEDLLPGAPHLPASDALALLEVTDGVRAIARWRRFGAILALAITPLVVKFLPAGVGRAGFVVGEVGFAGFTLYIAHALVRRAGWARIVELVLSCIGLLAFPLGTILSGLTLYYLTRPGAALVFSEIPVDRLGRHQIEALRDFRGCEAAVWIRRLVNIGIGLAIVGVALLGMLLATLADRHSPTAVAYRDVAAIDDAVRSYGFTLGHFPDTQPIDVLAASIGGGTATIPVEDPWGHPYRYERMDGGIRVGSSGPDGKWAMRTLAGYPCTASKSCDDIVWDGAQYLNDASAR